MTTSMMEMLNIGREAHKVCVCIFFTHPLTRTTTTRPQRYVGRQAVATATVAYPTLGTMIRPPTLCWRHHWHPAPWTTYHPLRRQDNSQSYSGQRIYFHNVTLGLPLILGINPLPTAVSILSDDLPGHPAASTP